MSVTLTIRYRVEKTGAPPTPWVVIETVTTESADRVKRTIRNVYAHADAHQARAAAFEAVDLIRERSTYRRADR